MRIHTLAALSALMIACPAAAQEDAGPAPDETAGAAEAERALEEERQIAREAMTGPAVPDINIALTLDGRAVAADTTDRDGLALLPAEDDGEYGVVLQEALPVSAALLIEVDDGRVMTVDIPEATPIDEPFVTFPAGPEATVFLRLHAIEADYVPPAPAVEPVQPRPEAPIEQTHDPEPEDGAGQ